MINGFRVFDAHAHLGAALHSGRVHTADSMLRAMDAAGVERCLLIPFPVVEDVRLEHTKIASALREHPGRFAGAACIPPFIPRAAFLDELRRCAEEYGFRALKLQPQYQPLNPMSPDSDWFFQAAEELKLSLVCHTGTGAPFALPSLFLPAALRHPQLPIVLSHCGGSSYYLEAIVAAGIAPNILLELSSLVPHQVLEVLKYVPATRLMVGSDLPSSISSELGKIAALEVDIEIRRSILWDTPSRLYGA